MKVILLVDDKKLGNKDSIIDVADSYARNVLIPKKLAIQATNDNLAKLTQRKEKEKKEYAEAIIKANKEKAILENLRAINIETTCAKDGKMFGAITNKDIACKLKEYNINIDKHNIILTGPIKACGAYTIQIKLFEDIIAKLVLNVISE